jgi:gliding motility-associated-like protein
MRAFLLFCTALLFSPILEGQTCFDINVGVNFPTLFAGGPCAGANTFDVQQISPTPGTYCTGCSATESFLVQGVFQVTADPGGSACTETFYVIGPDIEVSSSVPDCNDAVLSVSNPLPGVTYDWLINPGGQTASGNPANFTFTSPQPDVTVQASVPGCTSDITVTEANIGDLGPFPSLTFLGLINGFDDPLPVVDNVVSCTVPYCAEDLTTDNLLNVADNSQVDNGAVSYELTFNGTQLYAGPTPVGTLAIPMTSPANEGFNDLIYTIEDTDGCIRSKLYRVYWELEDLPQISITSVVPEITAAYCSGDAIDVTFEAGSANAEDVVYSYALGCNALLAEDINSVIGFPVLSLSPGASQTVQIPLNATSCGCTGDDLVIFALVENPCNPLEFDATDIIQVSLDFTPVFDAPTQICLGDMIDLEWDDDGQETNNESYCDPNFLWTIEDPLGVEVFSGNQPDVSFTPSMVGDYEFCLELTGNCAPLSNVVCQTVCVEAALQTSDFTVNWPTAGLCAPLSAYQPTVSPNPGLFTCDPLAYTWSIISQPAGAGATVSAATTTSPTFDLPVKGDYDLQLQVDNGCGPVTFTQTLTIIEEPQIDTDVINTQCAGDVIDFAEFFCVDLCGGTLDPTGSTLDIYDSSVNCPSSGTPLSSSALSSLPADMLEPDCDNTPSGVAPFVYTFPQVATTTTFTAILTISNECGSTCEAISFDVIAPGALSVPDPIAVCDDEPFDPSDPLFGAANLTWDFGGGLVWNPGDAAVNLTTSGPVTISGIVGQCNVSTSTQINILPAVNGGVVASATNFCPGSGPDYTLTANGTGVVDFQWYSEQGCQAGNILATQTSNVYTVMDPGWYSVTLETSNGCSECVEFQVLGDPAPNLIPPSITCYCDNQSTDLIPIGNLNPPLGSWGGVFPSWTVTEQGQGAFASSLNTAADPSIGSYSLQDLITESGSSSGLFDFEYTWTSPSNCTYTGQFTIEIEEEVIPQNPIGNTVCAGTVISLNNYPALSACTWTVNGAVVSGSFTIDAATTIDISCPSVSGCCTNTASWNIGVFDGANGSIVASANNFCPGSGPPFTLTASGTDVIAYQWFSGQGCQSGNILATETSDVYTVMSPGWYSVTLETSNGCSECVEFEVLGDPAPSLIPPSPSCFCDNQSAQLVPIANLQAPIGGWGANLPSWTVSEQGQVAFPSLLNTPSDPSASTYSVQDLLDESGLAQGIFDLEYTWLSPSNCTYTGVLSIEVEAEVIPVNPIGNTICAGTLINIAGYPQFASCTWTVNGVVETESFTVNGLTTIDISCTSASGCCTAVETWVVDVFDPIETSISSNVDFICNDGSTTVTLSASGNNSPQSFQWYNGQDCLAGNAIAGATLVDYDASMAGFYSVAITDANGCTECNAQAFELLTDPEPEFSCEDATFIYCENEVNEPVYVDSCLGPGNFNWGADLPDLELVDDQGAVVMAWPNTDPNSIAYTVQDLLNDYPAFNTTTTFTLSYTWTSASGCLSEGEYDITIQAIDVFSPITTPICQGETFILAGSPTGTWDFTALTSAGVDAAEIDISTGDLIWTSTAASPIGVYNGLVFDDGCLSFVFDGVELLDTPDLSIMNSPEMCIHDVLGVTLGPDVASQLEWTYTNDEGEFSLDPSTGQFEPLAEGVTSTAPGLFEYNGQIDHVVNGITYTCADTVESSLDIFDIPQNNVVPDVCEGEAFNPEFCSADGFTFTVDGSEVFTACPIEVNGLFGELDYELVLEYGAGCTDTTSGQFEVQQILVYDFSTLIDSCIPEVQADFLVTAGAIETITWEPTGFFTDDLNAQTVILPVGNPLQDTTFTFTATIEDGGCTTEQEGLSFDYVAPIEALMSVPDQDFCSPATIEFLVEQIGSDIVDSVIFIPGNGLPSQTFINDYDLFESVYEAPLDTTTFTAEMILFNPCDVDTVSVSFVIQPPVFSASLDGEFESCPGEQILIEPSFIGELVDTQIDVPGLLLSLVDESQPFLFTVPAGQAPGTYDLEMTLVPECGDPTTLTTQVTVHPEPDPDIDVQLACNDSPSVFTVSNAETQTQYVWLFPDGNEQTGASVGATFIEPGENTVLLESENVFNCTSTTSVTVDVPGFNPLPPFPDYSVCQELDLVLDANSSPGQDVQWSIQGNFPGSPVIFNVDEAPYTFLGFQDNETVREFQVNLLLSDDDICFYEDSFEVEILPTGRPRIEIDLQDGAGFVDPSGLVQRALVCRGVSFLYRAVGNYNDCVFTFGDNLENCGPADFCGLAGRACFIRDDEDAWIYLSTINSYLCESQDSLLMVGECQDGISIYTPNTFTPDEDGLNEGWRPILAGDLVDYELTIFDRYGQVVFQTADRTQSWNGAGVEDGDYYGINEVYQWQITFSDIAGNKSEQRGFVTLLR